VFAIGNDGPEILTTDYWETEHAQKGFVYLSGNAGAWRLLVPPSAAWMLPEMRTGHSAYIERSVRTPQCWDIVFDDGTESPFSISIDKRQLDRALEPGAAQLTVWVPAGKTLSLPLEIRI
jgi:hypothetical protein